MTRQIVLIGAGQTSASAARTLRRRGYDGDIVIVGDEHHPPYQRPPLSKEYLTGESGLDQIWATSPDWYDDNKVFMQLGTRAEKIDRNPLRVSLANGESLEGEAVLIATGGRARRFPGAAGESILYLRNIEDADRLRQSVRPGAHIVIVGGGFIGSELAASCRTLGADVTLLEALQSPFERVLGARIGAVCGEIHVDHGVTVRCDTTVETIVDTVGGATVITTDGTRIEGDVVVVGIGIEPNVDIAKTSELTVGNGIRVDEFCRTSAEGIYAAGDVANHYHPLFGRRMRVEHFDNATRQGAVAAKNMMGIRTRYDDPHWFWSDQYDYNFQYAGHAERWDRIVIRGSVEDRDFVAFYLLNGEIAGAFGVNRGGDIIAVKSILAARKIIDPEVLADADVDLADFMAEGAEADEEKPADDTSAPEVEGNFKRAARSGQVPEGIVRRFVVDGTELAIARSKGKAYAVHNLCTHLACHLASGKVEDDGLTCLCHGSIFDLATGEPINPPATRAVRTYPVMEKDGQIFVSIE